MMICGHRLQVFLKKLQTLNQNSSNNTVPPLKGPWRQIAIYAYQCEKLCVFLLHLVGSESFNLVLPAGRPLLSFLILRQRTPESL